MRIVTTDDVAARQVSSHRGSGILFRRLLQGRPDAPDNFELSVIQVDPTYRTPRHHHNFDQLHFVLEGEYTLTPERTMPKGTVTYFPEGAFYGPQGGTGARMISLQLAGASGNGFLSYDQLEEGNALLQAKGVFENGTYHSVGDDGKERRRDGYEAIWEEVRGRPVQYPAPRYDRPITIDPEAMEWVPSGDEPGVSVKHLGTFTERCTRVAFLRMEQGSAHAVGPSHRQLIRYVVEGRVRCGDEVGAGTAILVEPGESLTLEASDPAVVYAVDLPSFVDVS